MFNCFKKRMLLASHKYKIMNTFFNMTRLKILILLTIILLTPIWAQNDLPSRPQSWVTDYGSILTAAQKQILDSRLQELESNTSTQVFVAIFPSLPEGYYLEDFVNRLFEKWRPGLDKEDNGILLAIFINERKLRIEVGYGLEDVLTDAQSNTVIEDYIVPRFRQGDYYGGISDGLDAIIGAVEGKFKIPVKRGSENKDNDNIVFFIIFFFIIFLIIRSRRRYSSTYSRRGSRNSHWGGPIIWGGFGGGGRSGSGGGFGGGFGGLSGGGGASGSW
jgi:uncharacterized protein